MESTREGRQISPDSGRRKAEKDTAISSNVIVWKPYAPPWKNVALASVDGRRPDIYDKQSPVRLNINFGGLRGERLRLLNTIVALLDSYTGLFKGFGFLYDDGQSSFMALGPPSRISALPGLVSSCHSPYAVDRVRG